MKKQKLLRRYITPFHIISELKNSKKLLLVGPLGSGKTTLVDNPVVSKGVDIVIDLDEMEKFEILDLFKYFFELKGEKTKKIIITSSVDFEIPEFKKIYITPLTIKEIYRIYGKTIEGVILFPTSLPQYI